MAKTPPSRSYRLFSGAACFDWAFALSARTNTVNGAAVTASPATMLRLVIKFETVRAMITSRGDGADEVRCRARRKRPARDPAAAEPTAREVRYSFITS